MEQTTTTRPNATAKPSDAAGRGADELEIESELSSAAAAAAAESSEDGGGPMQDDLTTDKEKDASSSGKDASSSANGNGRSIKEEDEGDQAEPMDEDPTPPDSSEPKEEREDEEGREDDLLRDEDDEDSHHHYKNEENSLLPSDKHKFNAADTRRKDDDRALISAHSRLLKLRAELQKAQQKVDEAQRTYDGARNVARTNAQHDADDLLLEQTPWNNYYRQLKEFFEREGHSNFKRTITDADVEGLTEAEAKEIRTLSWWTCRQRKFKRRGELEQHKILLLNRLKFNYDPHAGPGPEKWLKNYALLKEFKAQYGHVKVPIKYAENKLGSWMKTQVTQYRNAQEGKLPALSAERIRLLEEIGINWGEKRITTPWDHRFRTLTEYKQRFGNVNVPWQWKENVALAQWVNSQRKKYKDLLEGKRNNLSEEQITSLNAIGFKWNTGGKGRYTEEEHGGDPEYEEEEMPSSNLEDMTMPSIPPFAAAMASTGNGTMSELTSNTVGGMPSLPAPANQQPQQQLQQQPQPPGFPTGVANQALQDPFAHAQDEYNNYLNGIDATGANGQVNRPMLGAMSEDAISYAQRLAHQNQQDLSMLAYAYQQLNQQMTSAPAPTGELYDQTQTNNGGPNFS